MFAFVMLGSVSSVSSQEIGLEERLRNILHSTQSKSFEMTYFVLSGTDVNP